LAHSSLTRNTAQFRRGRDISNNAILTRIPQAIGAPQTPIL
jgi:hypothetical protein